MFHVFESSVNSEGIETCMLRQPAHTMFESSVNSEGIETLFYCLTMWHTFESSVNSEGIETDSVWLHGTQGLRAV